MLQVDLWVLANVMTDAEMDKNLELLEIQVIVKWQALIFGK